MSLSGVRGVRARPDVSSPLSFSVYKSIDNMNKQFLIALLVLISIKGFAQNVEKEPQDAWHNKMWHSNDVLGECLLNIGLFPNGFFWVDIHGHTWLFIENPVQRLVEHGRPGCELSLNAYTYYNALDIAREQGWPVYHSLDDYPWMNPPESKYPPVFVQTVHSAGKENTAKQQK